MVDSAIDLWAEVCLGGWSLKISVQPSVVSSQPKVRAYDPLPTEQWKRKKEAELTAIGALKNVKKGFDRPVTARSNWG